MKKTIISFSGGVESTTMCLLYGKGATAIFADTGAEHKELYERLDHVEKYLKDYHKGDFELIKVKGKTRSREGVESNSLTEYIINYEFMPSPNRRFCTYLYKIRPIEKYLSKYDNIEMLIGLNYDEQGRTGNLQALKNCEYRYPLIEHELDREDCIDILNLHGLNPEFPIYMQRGGCKYCFFKKESEFKAMYYFDNDTFNEVKDLEEQMQGKKKKYFSIMPSGKSFSDLEEECKNEINNWGEKQMKEIYNQVSKTTYCGGFCHR